MSDLLNYFLQQERTKKAYSDYNAAGIALDRAQIHERLAEIKSQNEPLNKLMSAPMSERDRLYAAAHYVAYGRFPTIEEPKGAL